MSSINRPVQIEEFTVALRDVTDDELFSVKQQLQKSIAKLERTNTKLYRLINGEPVDSGDDDDDEFNEVNTDDRALFNEIIAENGIVIRNQQQRIDKVDDELEHRGLNNDRLDHAGEGGVKSTESSAKSAQYATADTDNDKLDSNAANSIFI